jgi:predicted RND superfamily exporter protein
MGPALKELEKDMSPFANLSAADSIRERLSSFSVDEPVSWVMWTERPITRYVASSSMQEEMQSSLLLGIIFVILVLWWGFRSLTHALLTTVPILLVVVWLYGLIYILGYSLNLVTVAIAAISLGVGIDYCIHVTERYREERSSGADRQAALYAIGGASGLALVGSAASDATGFLLIASSPMGLFASFGLFSALMIILSLFASMVLTTAAIGLIPEKPILEEE